MGFEFEIGGQDARSGQRCEGQEYHRRTHSILLRRLSLLLLIGDVDSVTQDWGILEVSIAIASVLSGIDPRGVSSSARRESPSNCSKGDVSTSARRDPRRSRIQGYFRDSAEALVVKHHSAFPEHRTLNT